MPLLITRIDSLFHSHIKSLMEDMASHDSEPVIYTQRHSLKVQYLPQVWDYHLNSSS